MNHRKGFTLVELLVVVAIIALLVSILLPAIGKARESAKAVVCSTSMKSLITGWVAYALENNDTMVPAFTYRSDWDITWQNESTWVWSPTIVGTKDSVPYPFADGRPTAEERAEGIERGSLFQYVPDVKVYRCPSDKSEYLRSYSIVDYLNGRQNYIQPSFRRWRSFVKMTDIGAPASRYVFIEEHDSRNYNMDSWEFNPNDDKWYDPLSMWHGRRSSLAFVDCHVEQKQWSDETADFFRNYKVGVTPPLQPITAEGIDDLDYMKRGWAK